MNPPLVTYRGCVKASECDHWGHLNTQFYLVKADSAHAALCFELGLAPSWLRSHNAAIFLRRNRVVFKRELRAGDTVYVRSGVRDAQADTLRFFSVLCNQEQDTVSAVFESEARLTDIASGAPVQLPASAIAHGAQLGVDNATFPPPAPMSAPRAPAVTPPQAIRTHRGTLGSWECDETGCTPPHFLIPHFSGAVTELMAHVGLPRPALLSRHIGYAALDCAFEHPVLLRSGQSIEIRSGVLDVGRKVLRIFHHVIETGTGKIVTVMEVVVVVFDLRTRKSVAMPEELVALPPDLMPRDE